MILYLYGGASDETRKAQQVSVLTELKKIKPTQILDVWFAIENPASALKKLEDFRQEIKEIMPRCRVLNAGEPSELAQAKNPLIYVTGGESNIKLLKEIQKRPTLLEHILSADYYFGTSAGAMIVSEKLRERVGDPLLIGLKILKNTVIEPHYTEWNRQETLRKEMKDWDCPIGIGISEACALVVDSTQFPNKYKTLGHGVIEIIQK